MQVLLELVLIDTMTLKIAKLKKIHSMAMVCKTEFEHVKEQDTKNKTPWTKSNLHKRNVKHLTTVMQSDNNKGVV